MTSLPRIVLVVALLAGTVNAQMCMNDDECFENLMCSVEDFTCVECDFAYQCSSEDAECIDNRCVNQVQCDSVVDCPGQCFILCRIECIDNTCETNSLEQCFSGVNLVEGEAGLIRMDQLQVGDRVRVRDGSFSEIHSFGHWKRDAMANFLRIKTTLNEQQPLEITEEHLLYVNGKLLPASKVRVGDMLESGALNGDHRRAQVVAVDKVIRRGIYAPFTMSGDIVVSNIVASNYVALPVELQDHIGSYDYQHWMQHAALTPFRAFCTLFSCQHETHDEKSGYSKPVAVWMMFVHFGEGLAHDSKVSLNLFLYMFVLPTLYLFVYGFSGFAAAVAFSWSMKKKCMK